MVRRPPLRLLHLKRLPIFSQLVLEEALLRTDNRNYFIYNEGVDPPIVVLGISGKPEKMLNMNAIQRDSIPLIKRFTGGGTVIVDNGTIFTSFICNSLDLPKVKPYPREIMNWSGSFYAPVFDRLCKTPGSFNLVEDDYVIQQKKVGGNAQSITKGRWVHHTSFLWDFKDAHMDYLQVPLKAPQYRDNRDHVSFVDRLSSHIGGHKESVFVELKQELNKHFQVEEMSYQELIDMQHLPHRQSNRYLETTDNWKHHDSDISLAN